MVSKAEIGSFFSCSNRIFQWICSSLSLLEILGDPPREIFLEVPKLNKSTETVLKLMGIFLNEDNFDARFTSVANI